MINSPIAALATGLIASQRLENVPGAEPFRNNFFVSSLLCGNAAGQLLFNMRTADDLAEALKDRAKAIEDGSKLKQENQKLKTERDQYRDTLINFEAKLKALGQNEADIKALWANNPVNR